MVCYLRSGQLSSFKSRESNCHWQCQWLDCCKYIPEQIRTVPLSYSRIFIVYLRDRRLVPKARTGVLADWGETCAQDIHC